MPRLDLVNASDLERWADRVDARPKLPELLRRLVNATGKGLTKVSFRAGDGIQSPGWDGEAEASEPDTHVPKGESVWEMGVSSNAKKKADDDYSKRTADPLGVDQGNATYVCVTPRRWSKKDAWVKGRENEGTWKAVRVYDADDLEQWLQRAPGVHAWFSALLGKDPYDAESIETWWESWSMATSPPLTVEILRSGRVKQRGLVLDFLNEGPSSLTIASDSQEESIAFIASVVHGEGAPIGVRERSLVVRTPSAWRRLAVVETPLTLIPTFERPDIALAIKSGHHVILPVGREISTSNVLPRLRRAGLEQCLRSMGIQEMEASRLASIGRRSLMSLRRELAVNKESLTPAWALPANVSEILPALLAGRWMEGNKADQFAIELISGRPYQEAIGALTKWSKMSDPPVRRVGDVWMIASKKDAWTLLARYLSPEQLKRYRDISVAVLSRGTIVIDELSEVISSSENDEQFGFSTHLIAGIADTLALMGAFSDETPLDGVYDAASITSSVVRRLLGSEDLQLNTQNWRSLSQVLPALAEGGPDEFLRACRQLVASKAAQSTFQDNTEDLSLWDTESAHTGILWALETLAWSQEHMSHATQILADYAGVDPGGRLLNRPINSLYNILVLWVRGTSASLASKIQTLDKIGQTQPEVAWKLLLMLLPNGHGSSTPPHKPAWRDWRSDGSRGIPIPEYHAGVAAVSERLLNGAVADPSKWIDILNRFADFPLAFQTAIITNIENLDSSDLPQGTGQQILDTARTIATRHRAFPDAEWSLPSAIIEGLESAAQHLESSDVVSRNQWLFARESRYSFIQSGDGEQQRNALQIAQNEAVSLIYSDLGISGLVRLISHFEAGFTPGRVGAALSHVDLSLEEELLILELLDSEELERQQLAQGYFSYRFINQPDSQVQWLESLLASSYSWSTELRVRLMRAMPVTSTIWDIVASLGAAVENGYWRTIDCYGLPAGEYSCIPAAENLLKFERPHHAIDLLDLYAEDLPDGPPDDLVAECLEAAAKTQVPDGTGRRDYYHAGRLLDRLFENGFDPKRLATLEWLYLPAFRFEHRKAHVLHEALSESPDLFVSVISMCYRGKNEEPRELSEQEEANAASAMSLLDSWRKVPGTGVNGEIDRERLFAWVNSAREDLRKKGRLKSGDHRIGRVLVYGPPGNDSMWPNEHIMDLIENLASDDLDLGFELETYNSRGMTSRGVTDGGDQERELAERYSNYAETARESWPRVAKILSRLSRTYLSDAKRHDLDADLTEDLWG